MGGFFNLAVQLSLGCFLKENTILKEKKIR